MEGQLIQAVEIASNPQLNPDPQLKSQALSFLEHVKSIPHENWSVGWAVWSARDDSGSSPKYSQNARMFGLILVDEFLNKGVSNCADPAGAIASLQEAAVNYIEAEYVQGTGDQSISFLKNKFAQVLSALLLQTYNLPPPFTLLPTLLATARRHPSASPATAGSSSQPPLNPLTSDLLLRVLHDLSVTLGSDATLRAVRSKERLQRDAAVRDEIRASHAASIAETVWRMVEEGATRVNQGPQADGAHQGAGLRQMTFKDAVELTGAATKVIEDYVSWIDIGLVVTNETVPILFNLLHHSIPSLRTAAADALLGIISKGMKPADKLSLAQALNLTEVITSLEARTRTSSAADGKGKANGAGSGDDSDENVEFREHLAKLTNGLVLELCKILEEVAAEDSTRSAADAMLTATLPLALCFLSDEFDETSEQMLSGINVVLSLYKKAKRRTGAVLSPARSGFLANLISVVLQKMKFDSEAEWSGASFGAADDDEDSEDEDAAKFIELRRNLQTVIGAIAAIDGQLFSSTVHSLVIQTFSAFEASAAGSGPQLEWQQVELALNVVHFYGDVLVSALATPKTGLSPGAFVQLPDESSKARNAKLSSEYLAGLPLNNLGEVVQQLVKSNVSAYPHPAVQLQFFECLIRYSAFFATRTGCVSDALMAFLDWRGLHHDKVGVRKRVNYLFYRFIKDLRTNSAIPADFVQKLLEGMQDVLVVRAELPEVAADEDPLEKATAPAGYFDSQLYLFETSGLLVSLLNTSADSQVMLLKAIANPLMEQQQQSVQAFAGNSADLRLVLQVHHLMLALSSLAKGFPDLNANSAEPEPQWVGVFKSVTEQILMSLSALNRFSIIREAARGAFARIVTTIGKAALPYIPGLIDGLLNEVSSQELIDFINFLGLVVNKFKENVKPIMDELFLVLVNRIFVFLNQSVSGTDDAVQRTELQRAYINLISSMVGSNMEGVFISEKNRGQLETLLQSIVFYSSNSDPMCQKSAVSILHRLVSVWGDASASASSAALPGFERFIYENLVGLIFEAPTKESFDPRDAQCQMVLGEIATLAKTIYQKRGEESVEYLANVYLPGINCPPDLAQDFTNNLKTLEAKPFKKYLENFIARSRGG